MKRAQPHGTQTSRRCVRIVTCCGQRDSLHNNPANWQHVALFSRTRDALDATFFRNVSSTFGRASIIRSAVEDPSRSDSSQSGGARVYLTSRLPTPQDGSAAAPLCGLDC